MAGMVFFTDNYADRSSLSRSPTSTARVAKTHAPW